MIIDASKRFAGNAIKHRNLKASGVSPGIGFVKTKNKISAINEKIKLPFSEDNSLPEDELNEEINAAIEEQESSSADFKEELKKLEFGSRKVSRHECQEYGKALRSSYGVICLRSIEIARYFDQGLFSYQEWQESNFTDFLAGTQRPLLKGLTELTYDFPDYDPIVDFLLKKDGALIEYGIEPEGYEKLTKRLLVAMRKGSAEYWTTHMEQAWKNVLGESYVYLQEDEGRGTRN